MPSLHRLLIRASALVAATLFALMSPAQAPSTPATSTSAPLTPETAGVATPWELRKMLDDIAAAQVKLKPVLAKMNPKQWYDQKGAPALYIDQVEKAQKQIDDSARAASLLAQHPENVAAALDTYFRMEALDNSTRSISQGARRYATRQEADTLDQLIAQNFTTREHFRTYLTNLATTKQDEFRVADQEAQRCRGMISKEPATRPKRKP